MDNPTSNPINNNPINNSKFSILLFPVFVFIFSLLFLNIFFLYSPNKDALTTISTTLITLTSFFVLGLFVTVLMRMKSGGPAGPKKSGLSFLQAFNSNLALLIVYVISLIFIFSFFSSQTINKYAIYFLLGTVIPGIFLFYKNIAQQSAVVYTDEKIRFFITAVSFILTMILFYNADPGGYIKKYFGVTMLLTILLTVFGILYMLTLSMLPDRSKNSSSNEKSSFFEDFKSKGFTSSSVLFTIAFILYLILITVGISIYPGGASGFFKSKTFSTAGIIMSIFVVLILSIAFFMYNFKFFGTSKVDDATEGDKINTIFKNALLLIFGLSFSGVLIAWIVYMITNLSSSVGIFSFILNILLVVAVMSLVYRLIIGTSLYRHPFFKLIINILFYIPCLFVGLIEGIVWLFGGLSKMAGAKGIQMTDGKTDNISLIILVITVLLFLVYLFRPSIEKQIFKQGGNLLINQPITTNELHAVSDYLTLNQPSKSYDYQYGMSFWFRLDADSPSTNASYKKYANIFSYGGKPNIMYNASTNTLIVSMKVKDEPSMSSSPTFNAEPRDENGDLIVYTKTGVLLQKWNHVVINYNGGTLDVFYNGELVKSVYGVVPYMEYDALNVGQENGVYGELCNLNYFTNKLKLSQVYYLYNLVKNRDPPISYDTNENIIKQPKPLDLENIRGSFEVSKKKIEEIAGIDLDPVKVVSKTNPVDPENYFSLKWYFAQQGDDFGMP